MTTANDLSGIIELTVGASGVGMRLDAYLARELPFSRSGIQRLIDRGDIVLNGKAPQPKTKLRAGDTVTITPPPPAIVDIAPQNIPIDIVYQDSSIVIVNKPKGMVVHPAAGNPDGTLVNALMYHVKDLSGIGGELRPGIVHRIDKMTSGLLVIAKNDPAHIFLSEQLKTHNVSRIYYALAEGNFKQDDGVVNMPIARSRSDRQKMAIDPTGRCAVTHYTVLERFGNITFLRLELETGRTHQIRLHMAYIKHPLVGDNVYGSGGNKLGISGQALHAGELRLVHPDTGERMVFTAPLPQYFTEALNSLGSQYRFNG